MSILKQTKGTDDFASLQLAQGMRDRAHENGVGSDQSGWVWKKRGPLEPQNSTEKKITTRYGISLEDPRWTSFRWGSMYHQPLVRWFPIKTHSQMFAQKQAKHAKPHSQQSEYMFLSVKDWNIGARAPAYCRTSLTNETDIATTVSNAHMHAP